MIYGAFVNVNGGTIWFCAHDTCVTLDDGTYRLARDGKVEAEDQTDSQYQAGVAHAAKVVFTEQYDITAPITAQGSEYAGDPHTRSMEKDPRGNAPGALFACLTERRYSVLLRTVI